MPKIVDHESQRVVFAKAVMRILAREGLEGVTMRAVAKEAGLSYGSLFHYFGSKEDLLLHAVRYSTNLQGEWIDHITAEHKGLKALEMLLVDDSIVNESSRDPWMTWLTFTYKAALDERFAKLNAALIQEWLARITELLRQAKQAGEVPSDLDLEFEAKAVWAYSAGVGQLGLLHPEALPVTTQRQLIHGYLAKLSAG
ncbi:MAG: TetR/AcrR family transcriptional regulator [Pseudomonadota bacterium]